MFAVAGVRLLPGAASIVSCFNFLNYASEAVNTVYRDLKKLRKKNINIKLQNKKSNFKEINFKSLSLKNIYYKYPNTKKGIIKDASINLKAKECVGIVGESGSGKTTIIDILLGLLKPHKGQILVNDKKIDQNSNSYVKLISYLPQEPLILEDTIKANICLDSTTSKLKKSNKKLNTAIVQANIKQFIKTLPNGIYTRIGESGVRLSGGQNKRVAIARTFFHDKEIIIMDEATSSLDVNTENFILDQIKSLKRKKTIIIITHSKNTLKYCDKIYEIKAGKIKRIKFF